MKHNRIFLRIGLLSLVLLLGLLGGYRLTSATDNGPELYPSAICGHAGDIVVIEGINFTPNVLVEVTWAEMVLGTDPFPVQADPAGYLYFQFVVPNDIEGPRPLRVKDGQQVAEIIFNLGLDCPPPATATPVEPILTPTAMPTLAPPTMGPEVARLVCQPEGVQPDTLFQVSGENFQPGVSLYQFRWDGVVIPASPVGLTVGDDGKFAASVVAPADSYEIHTLVVDDGHGGVAPCYVNLIPRDPTPTSTATPTVTPSPTATWTPGPPPGISLSPTPPPGPGDYCAAIEAAFTRYPLVGSQIDAGITVTNLNLAWPAGQVEIRLWQYYNLFEWDTGLAQPLPAMMPGETVPLHLKFVSPQSGPTWFQVRLHDIQSGAELPCPSAWFPLQIIQADPYPPALLSPADNTWLDSRTLTMDWLPAEIPDERAGRPETYEVQLIDLGRGLLLYQATEAPLTEISYTLSADYGARQLAWRSRASNAAGWGRWSTALYFGVDTVAPTVEMSLAGDQGENGWWRSPLTVRVGGQDPAPGSGLQATFLQVGENRWAQVIPGGATTIEAEGVFEVRAYSRDGATHRSRIAVLPVKIDLSPPDRVEAHFSVEPSSSGWYTRPVTLRVEAEDRVSGVVSQSIRLDGGPWQADELTLGTDGWHRVEFMAQDEAGHTSAIYQTTANLDTAAPAGALSLNGSLCQTCAPATINVTVEDDHSGLAHWTLALIVPEPTPPALNPQGNLLASGSDQTRTIALEGGSLPAGSLILRLTVQDGAGWLTTKDLEVTNASGNPGPTPTPWLLVTATPWPTSSGQMTATPQPTVTATSGDQQDDDDNDDENIGNKGSGNNGSGGNSPGWIGAVAPVPTGVPALEKTTIPAILPVTGGVAVAWGLGSSIALLLLGLMLWLALTKSTRLLPVKFRLRTGIRQDQLHSERDKE